METKILHSWTINITKEIDETLSEERDGQTITITKKVKKEMPVKMALKQPTRSELRQAEFFYGQKFNDFITLRFLPRSILINKHLDLTGGVLSQKEKDESLKLTQRLIELEQNLVRSISSSEEEKNAIKLEMVSIRSQISNINAANESVFSQTAEAKAQKELNLWFGLFLVLIEKNGNWTPYFEGSSFEEKEKFMWALEDNKDEFYKLAIEKITTYVGIFNMGASTPEQFKFIEEELQKQLLSEKQTDKEENKENIKEESSPNKSEVNS